MFPDAWKSMPKDVIYLRALSISILTGGGGHDFMDGTADAFIAGAALHLKHGTTSLFPTISASSASEIKSLLKNICRS